MPQITLEIHVHMPWGNTVLTKHVPQGTKVGAVLQNVSMATKGAECIVIANGKALLPDHSLEETTQLSILPLLCGG